jgi:hypothetical protein
MDKINLVYLPSFIKKMIVWLLANILSGFVLSIFFTVPVIVILYLSYFLINFVAILIKRTKKYFLILTLINGISLLFLIITLICIYLFIDEIELASHGVIVIYPLGLSIIYFLFVFIIDMISRIRNVKNRL